MANTVLPLSSDIYLEVDGKKVVRDGEIVEDLSGGQKEKIVRLLRGEE